MTFSPSSPGLDSKSNIARRLPKISTTTSTNRMSKRSSASSGSSDSVDGRPKRVWKACERCRMKKTKVCICLEMGGALNFYWFLSVTENRLASDAEMMVKCVWVGIGKRRSSNQRLKGQLIHPSFTFPPLPFLWRFPEFSHYKTQC